MTFIHQGTVSNININNIFESSNNFSGLSDHIEIAIQLQQNFDQVRYGVYS